MAVAVASLPGSSRLFSSDPEAMNTIPDPRTPSPQPHARRGSSDPTLHPDLSSEVATLSTKLVNAINHQTTLDDRLQATRHDLEAAREQIARLDAAAEQHRRLLEQGLLVHRKDVEEIEARLSRDLSNEKSERNEVEKEKKAIEVELEGLTSALFEEANSMVAAARRELSASERRNEQMRAKLNDTELLLTSHQEQLQDLKAVMQQMTSSQSEIEGTAPMPTSPSTPGRASTDGFRQPARGTRPMTYMEGSAYSAPNHPLHFSHLISPVVRTDLPAYDDFLQLFKTSQHSAPTGRIQSGNFGGLNVMGLASLKSNSQTSLQGNNLQQPTNGSNTSLPTSSPTTPNLSVSALNSSPREVNNISLSTLKELRYFKRALFEDIEPTLRLEHAPGLSWLARRSVLSSISTGTLIVEPIPAYIGNIRSPDYPCSLCGESRNGELYARKHRFRTSDSEDAQRYPLCEYCLGRLRASCDFVGFLRMVRDGHLRGESKEEQRHAWEQSVRLRERMFWARLGGGVVPTHLHKSESSDVSARPSSEQFSPRPSSEQVSGRTSSEQRGNLSLEAIRHTELQTGIVGNENDPFAAPAGQRRGRISIGKTIISKLSAARNSESESKEAPDLKPVDGGVTSTAQYVDSENAPNEPTPEREQSILGKIPGGFD